MVDVVTRLARDAPGDPIEVFAYEHEDRVWNPGTPWQPQIPRPGRDGYELVVCLFGERAGSPLPDDGPLGFAVPDDAGYGGRTGRYPLTGTLFEFFEALDSQRRLGLPKLLLYFKGDRTILDRSRRFDQRNWGGGAHYRQLEEQARTRGHSHLPLDDSRAYWEQLEWLTAFADEHTASSPWNRLFLETEALESGLEADLRDRLGLSKPFTTTVGKGLQRFDIEDKRILFGRQADVRQIVDSLRLAADSPPRVPMLVLHGRSGSGKSSAIRAGVAARLADGSFARSLGAEFVAAVVSPGELPGDPLDALFTQLRQQLPQLQLPENAGADGGERVPSSTADVVCALQAVLGTRRLFLALDQFEEVLALPPDVAHPHWDRVLELLHQIAARRLGYTALVIKQDWLPHWNRSPWAERLIGLCYEEFPDTIEKATTFEIVQRSFESAGYVVEPALLDHLWAEFRQLEGKSEAVLPLLAVALEQLRDEWTRRSSSSATFGLARVLDSSYTSAVTLASVIGRLGDAAFEQSRATPEQLARVLRMLVTMTITMAMDDARHSRSLATVPREQFPREDAPLLAALASHRLVLQTSETVRLTHDVILDRWPRARDWWDKEQQHIETRVDVGALLYAGADLPFTMLDRAERMVADWRREPGTEPSSEISQFVQRHMGKWFDPNHPCRADGEPRLIDAVRLGNVELATLMLDAGADPNLRSARPDSNALSPLMCAAWIGNAALVDLLLARHASIDAENGTGLTALEGAIVYEQLDIARTLVARGADADHQGTVDGTTPLMAAAWVGDRAAIDLLLDAGAGLDHVSTQGHSALALAVQQGHDAAARTLIERGASFDNAGHVDWDVPALVAEHGDATLMELAIARGLDPAALLRNRSTPLIVAAGKGRQDIVDLLLRSGRIDVNATDPGGRTAFAEAMAAGHQDVVRALVAGGATLNFWYEQDDQGVVRLLESERLRQAFVRQFETASGDWPMLPLLDGEWESVAPAEAAAVMADSFGRMALNRFGHGLRRISRLRRRDLPFYEGATLYEALAVHANGTIGCLTFVRHASGTWLLDGTSPPIHEMNSRLSVKLDTQERALCYFRFFCNGLTSEFGTFTIIESPQRLAWLDETPLAVREPVALKARPAMIWANDEKDCWNATAVIRYSNALFTAEFSVEKTGMITETSDEVIATMLPLRPEAFVFGIRTLVAPTEVAAISDKANWFELLTRSEKAAVFLERIVRLHGARWTWDVSAVEVMSLLMVRSAMTRAELHDAIPVPRALCDAAIEDLVAAGWASNAGDAEGVVLANAPKLAEMEGTLRMFGTAVDKYSANLRGLCGDFRDSMRGHTCLMHLRLTTQLHAWRQADSSDILKVFADDDERAMARTALDELTAAGLVVDDDEES